MTATRSDVEESAVHSASPEPEDVPGEANAQRAHVRASVDDRVHSRTPRNAVTVGDICRRIGAVFTQPDFYAEDLPALRHTVAYAKRGEWTPEKGLPRFLGVAYARLFAIPVKYVLRHLDWVVDRSSRLCAEVVLLVLLDQFPPLSWLINVDKLPPLSWLI